MLSPPLLLTLTIATALLLSGCINLPTTYSKKSESEFVIPERWQSKANAEPLSNQLLFLVDDPNIKQLVEQALSNNLDLQQTAIRLQEQQLLTRQVRALESPDLDLSFSSQRTKSVNEITENNIANNHSLSLNLSWELDVWGRLADATASAQAQTSALERDYHGAQNSLAGRVIQKWITLNLQQLIIDAEKARIQSLKNTEEVITERYRDGLGNIADLETARAAKASAEASLAEYLETQRSTLRELNLLLGITPQNNYLQNNFPLNYQIPVVENPPSSIPANVIAARPDMQAAYYRILSADKEAAVAYKQLLPGFSFSTDLNQARPELGDLLKGGVAWNLLAQMTAPLFNSGRLQAGANIAEKAAQRAYLSYQQTLLIALQEVEDALSRESSLSKQKNALSRALEHSLVSLKHYRSRYREGLADILDLLNAEQSAFDARTSLLQIRQNRLNNRIALGLALGMGV